jgi:CHAD domain-containing protein
MGLTQVTARGGRLRLRPFLTKRAAAVLRPRRRVRDRGDPEAVHDLRVATRRLQEALRFSEPFLPRPAVDRVARRARGIRRSLGAVRDADVLFRLLRRLARRLERGERRLALGIAARLSEEAEAARRAADRRGGLPVPGIRKRLQALLKAARPVPVAVSARGRQVALERLARAARLLPRARRGDPDGLHAFRIAVKRYRYGLEILDEAGARGLRALIREARDLQRALGRVHDLDVLTALIAEGGDGRGAAGARRRLLRRLAAERGAALRALGVRLDRFRPRDRAAAITAGLSSGDGAGARGGGAGA